MSKRPVSNYVMDRWLQSVLAQRAIWRGLLQCLRAVPSKDELHEWAEHQRAFEGPVLVA